MADSRSGRDIFSEFLKLHYGSAAESLLQRFGQYLELLYAQNRVVNLISRQMPPEDYWLYHFLDSLLIINTMDLYSEKVLDFGSGGGLPGIPLKLVYGNLDLILLDSVGKKVRCLDYFISELNLQNCRAVWSRLEDFAQGPETGSYDLVLCRSVRMEPVYFAPLLKLLKRTGKAVFYKAQQLDDVSMLPGAEIFDVSQGELGRRQIVVAGRGCLEQHLKNKRFG